MGRKKKKTSLTIASQPRSVSIKVYIEQLMDSDTRALYEMTEKYTNKDYYVVSGKSFKWTSSTRAHAQAFLQEAYEKAKVAFFKRVKAIDKKYMVFTICHDKDQVASNGDFFKPAFKKPHFHIWVWRAGSKRFRISKVFTLLGLTYTKEDNKMIFEHGVEPIKSKSASLMYATHETPQAIADGKYEYSVDEIVTNQDKDTILAIRDGYQKAQPKKKLSDDDWDAFAGEAYELGKEAGDFEKWTLSHFTTRQQSQAPFRIIHKRYEAGLDFFIGHAKELVRCSVLIYGEGGLGKSHSTRDALRAICGDSGIYFAKKGTGKYDGLSSSDSAMVFDDVMASEARQVFDNYPAVLHRRNSGDRPWLGSFAVATANEDPWLWVAKASGMSHRRWALRHSLEYAKKYKLSFGTAKDVKAIAEAVPDGLYEDEMRILWAVYSRLYICTVTSLGTLKLISSQKRGRDAEHDALFTQFKSEFEKSLKGYLGTEGLEDTEKAAPKVLAPKNPASLGVASVKSLLEKQNKKLLDDDDLPF